MQFFSFIGLFFAALSLTEAIPTPSNFLDLLGIDYFLVIEYTLKAYLTQGLAQFSIDEFLDDGLEENVRPNIVNALQNHQQHILDLSAVITSSTSNPPVPLLTEPTYLFPCTITPYQFVVLAADLEGLATSAYVAATSIVASYTTSDFGSIQDLASIAATTARHSAFLRLSLHEFPFPNPYETSLSPSEVFTYLSQFWTGNQPDMTGVPGFAYGSPLYIDVDEPYYQSGDILKFKDVVSDAGAYAVFYSGLNNVFSSTGGIISSAATIRDNIVTNIPFQTPGLPVFGGQVWVVLHAKVGGEDVLYGPASVEVKIL